MEKKKADTEKTDRRKGGLYAKVNMSVKSANIMVATLVILLVAALIFVVSHSGFTVKFDTDGGSHVESVKVMHSNYINVDPPVKEGWKFKGWYKDRACTEEWNMSEDTVTDSMTLYAGWEKV